MNNKKNILFIMSSLGGGGAEKVLITLLKFFDYSKYDVELCLLNKVGTYINEIPSEVKITVVYENPNSLRSKIDYNLYSKTNIDYLERISIRSKIKRQYDTIISFCEGRSLKFHSYVTDRAKNNITWVHIDLNASHYTINETFKSEHERFAYSLMDKIIFVSKEACNEFSKVYPEIGENRKFVIYNINDIERIKSYKLIKSENNDIFKICCVGGFRPQKAFDRVIRLAHRLKLEGHSFKIDIIGEGSLRKDIEDQIAELEVSDVINLKGFINPPYSLMAEADIFLSTSLHEGFPMVHCEALCLGLPIVSTRCTGPNEILGEGNQYGLLVNQDDESIYQGVKKMIEDTSLREHYSKKAEERISIFSPNAIMKKIEDIL